MDRYYCKPSKRRPLLYVKQF